MNAINLLKETTDYMNVVHEKTEDVEFVGSRDRAVRIGGWDEFKALADFMYDDDYGNEEVVTDLIIAFKDGSVMFRETYDGSEWWSFIRGSGCKRAHGPLTLNTPHLKGVHSLKEEYENQLKEEADSYVKGKMKELWES